MYNSRSRKVNIVFFISVLLLILIAGFSYFNIRTFSQNEKRIERTNLILTGLEDILSGLKDAQTAQRGFLLTGDSTFIDPYKASYQKARRKLEDIDSLIIADPVQQIRIDSLENLIDENYLLVQNSLVSKAQGEMQNEEESSLVFAGRESLNTIRNLVRQMQEEEKKLLLHQTQEAFKSSQVTPLGLILFFCLAMILAVVSFLYTLKNLHSLRVAGRELQKSHTELEDTKLKLQGVLNSSISGIVAFKSIRNEENEIIDFELVLANPASESLTGHDLRDNPNKKMLDIFPESKISQRFAEYVKVANSGIPLNKEYYSPYYQKWFQFSVVKLEDGIALTFSDITDKKLAEEQLKETRHFLEQITDATPDIVFVANLHTGKIIFVNKEIFLSLGISVAEVYAMEPDDRAALIHPADRQKRNAYFQQFVEVNDHEVKEIEYRIKDVNGNWRFFCLRCKVFKRGKDYAPAEIVGIAQDISDKKEKETAIDRKNEELIYAYDELKKVKEYLLKVNQELEERVEERTKTLSDKNLELLKINEFLDTIVYMAAHDLRSPVSSLNLLVNLFEKSQDALKKENIMEAIKSSTKRLDQTIKGLVEVIEVQNIQSDIIKTIQFSEVFAPILEENQQLLENKNGKVVTNFEECEQISYIEAYIASILKNLLTNAIKYAGDERDLLISVTTRKVENFVVLTFSDSGIGMDLNRYGKNLFKPFKRFTDKAEGKGIGLHLIKNMIEKNGGSIEVKSELNKGTTFICYLKNYSTN